MPIQPYFPEPLTVTGNVAEAKHRDRVRFVRRVVAGHSLTVLTVITCAAIVPLMLPARLSFVLFLGGLVALTFERRAFLGGLKDNLLSIAFLLPTLFSLSQFLRSLHAAGWPVLTLVPAVIGLALYALFCGNDFSYFGQLLLCGVLTIVSSLFMGVMGVVPPSQVLFGTFVAFCYIGYYVYDLSMIVKRRKMGEEIAAVADLYRDLINFVTYSVRVYFHWRKFRFI